MKVLWVVMRGIAVIGMYDELVTLLNNRHKNPIFCLVMSRRSALVSYLFKSYAECGVNQSTFKHSPETDLVRSYFSTGSCFWVE